jgi:REP element-mobilizing transposase RayT
MPETATKPKPLYTGENTKPAYEVRYDWTGWPSAEPFPPSPPSSLFDILRPLWESDGLRLLKHWWTTEQIHLTFSATPHVSPILCATRSKGRMQHTFRKLGQPVKFSRKVSLRTIGHNQGKSVENYIRAQVGHAIYADPEYAKKLQRVVIENADMDLSQPTSTTSGRYWYNLHVVLVTESRHCIHAAESLSCIRDGCLAVADKRGFQIATGSVLPDHLHLALRGDIERSPHVTVLCFQNNLACRLGRKRVWMDTYYVGTFGEYDMKVVRRPA